MGTMKRSCLRAVTGLVATAVVMLLAGHAGAQNQIAVDKGAAILVYPKIVVDSTAGINTVVEIANTNTVDPVAVHCFYANALGRCSVNSAATCLVNFDCPAGLLGERCIPDWRTTDFSFTLTREQVVGWNARDGLRFLPCDPNAPPPSEPVCVGGQQNANLLGPGAAVSGTDDPFVGELKCVQVDATSGVPVDANDLIGRATIEDTSDGLDIGVYNAIGIEDRDDTANNGDNILCLGSNGGDCVDPEYASCPQVLILDHYFEGAEDPNGAVVTTDLTLVPCSEFEEPRPGRIAPDVVPTTVQFLVYNEFEQRLSTATRAVCYTDLQLADIDTRASYLPDDGASVFAVGVNGTLTGQTRIRGVATTEEDAGHGLLGVARERHTAPGGPSRTGLFALDMFGTREQADIIRITPGP